MARSQLGRDDAVQTANDGVCRHRLLLHAACSSVWIVFHVPAVEVMLAMTLDELIQAQVCCGGTIGYWISWMGDPL